jgi:ATP-dependent DNA helicase RecG
MQNEQLIKSLISQKESEKLELIEGVRKESLGKILCGFLNGIGGQVLVGVKVNGKIIGVRNAVQQEKELQQYFIKNIIPEPAVTVSSETVDGKKIILIEVWSGSNKPYVFSGSIFYRRNAKTVQATSKEIASLIHNRQVSEIHWERQSVMSAELDDLDLDEIKNTISVIARSGRGKEMQGGTEEFLSHYGLYQNGNITNAAMILFGKEPSRFLPQCRIRFAVLTGGKTSSTFQEDRILEGNLFKNREGILELLKKNLAFRSDFEKANWQRKDEFIYPMDALREGVMNALLHRDYSNPSGSASVIVYSDKLEITNYGKLPAELKVTDLKRNHESLPHNPDIAHICFLKGYIEKIGRGTLKVIEACRQAGIKAPVWKSDGTTVKLTFYSNVKLRLSKGTVEGTSEGTTKGTIEGTVEGTLKATIEGIVEGAVKGTTENVREKIMKLIVLLNNKEGPRAAHIAKAIRVPVKSTERYIKVLRDAGIIEFKGKSNQTGGYYLTKNVKVKIKKAKTD